MPKNRSWDIIKIKFEIGNKVLNRILFGDDKAIFSKSEDDIQRVNNRVENVVNGLNMRISNTKTKIAAFQEKNHIICKIMIGSKAIEQVSKFNYIGFNVSYCLE
jgi:hypothetical protein